MGPLEYANNKELLSTLAGEPAAGVLMEKFGGLTSLARASFDELQSVKGIGKSKAAAIKSAFLLAQRLSRETYGVAPILDMPERMADFLRESNRLYTVENFQVVFVNTRRRMIGMEIISQGTLDTILVHPREVFYPAICRKAAAIVLAHNLCVAAHKLCYVECGFMWSKRAETMASGCAIAVSRLWRFT
jgi:DNA repair protein RadC